LPLQKPVNQTTMIRKSLLAVFFLPMLALGQNIDYNKIILPEGVKEIQFSEKLVRLAWANNPDNQALLRQVTISEYGEKLAKRNFLNQISATGNLNEFNVNPPVDAKTGTPLPNFFPKYNFAATLNFGNIFSDPIRVKRAKEETAIANYNVNSRKLTLRAEVLRRYQKYLTNKELFKVQTDALEDASASFSLAEQKFKNGETKIVDFNSALENFNSRKSQKLIAERDFNISKIDIEELIGVRLEDVN
jgi:outer membrane protein TolC